MIRRNTTCKDGTPGWALITQLEHARIAGELAKDWGGPPVATFPWPEIVLPTVFHHDDGWDSWERRPSIDPKSGKPLAFTEMPNDVAHDIWQRSIERVAEFGPLAQYMVAEHFMRLRRGGDELDEECVRLFLQEYDARCAEWLTQWQAEDATGQEDRTKDAAERVVDFLQTFDVLSLYLCCTPRKTPYHVETPGGQELTLHINAAEVTVTPWPWQAEELSLSTTAKVLPAHPLENDKDLHAAMETAESKSVSWRLVQAMA
mgnify:CR=1 FL=1